MADDTRSDEVGVASVIDALLGDGNLAPYIAGTYRMTVKEAEKVVAELKACRDRIVTVDIDGRSIKFDKLAEAEAALDEIERAHVRLYEAVVGLRGGAFGTRDYVSVHRDRYVALMKEAGVDV